MTGLQILLSVIMSFFFPGLGQLYQGLFFADRVRIAFYLIASLPICVACVIGIVFLPLVWLFSFGECCWWALQKSGITIAPPASSVAQACLLTAVLLSGSSAFAARDTAPVDAPRDVITGRWEFVRASNSFAFVPDPAGPYMNPALAVNATMPAENAPCQDGACPNPGTSGYVDDCCKCTALRHCRSNRCSRDAATCHDCPCHEKGDPEPKACSTGACGQRGSCGAACGQRTGQGSWRRATWRRSCRSCR
jgi:hypothetical protein